MKNLGPVICLFLFLIISSNEVLAAKIVRLRGTVFDAKTLKKFSKGDEVEIGTTVVTKSRSFAKIELEDKSTISIGAKSRVKIEQFSRKKPAIINLIQGHIRSNVSKDYMEIDKSNFRSKFYIRSKSAALGVRGTEFDVIHDGGTQDTFLIVLEGVVAYGALKKPLQNPITAQQLEKIISAADSVLLRRGSRSMVIPSVEMVPSDPIPLDQNAVDQMLKDEFLEGNVSLGSGAKAVDDLDIFNMDDEGTKLSEQKKNEIRDDEYALLTYYRDLEGFLGCTPAPVRQPPYAPVLPSISYDFDQAWISAQIGNLGTIGAASLIHNGAEKILYADDSEQGDYYRKFADMWEVLYHSSKAIKKVREISLLSQEVAAAMTDAQSITKDIVVNYHLQKEREYRNRNCDAGTCAEAERRAQQHKRSANAWKDAFRMNCVQRYSAIDDVLFRFFTGGPLNFIDRAWAEGTYYALEANAIKKSYDFYENVKNLLGTFPYVSSDNYLTLDQRASTYNHAVLPLLEKTLDQAKLMEDIVKKQLYIARGLEQMTKNRMGSGEEKKTNLKEILTEGTAPVCYRLQGRKMNLDQTCSCLRDNSCGFLPTINKKVFQKLNESNALRQANFSIPMEIVDSLQMSRDIINKLMKGEYLQAEELSDGLVSQKGRIYASIQYVKGIKKSYLSSDYNKTVRRLVQEMSRSQEMRRELLQSDEFKEALLGNRTRPSFHHKKSGRQLRVAKKKKKKTIDLEPKGLMALTESKDREKKEEKYVLDTTKTKGLSYEQNKRRSTGRHEISKDRHLSLFKIISTRYLKSFKSFK
jgi:hypothetical protein